MSDLLNQASLVYIPSGYKEDTAYSVIPTDGSGDLTFSRASDGTRVNSQGLVERVPWNLAGYSEEFNNAIYTVKSAVTIVDNSTTAPNGTTTADLIYPSSSGSFRYVAQTFTKPENIYTLSVYAKAQNKNVIWMYIESSAGYGLIYFDLSDGTMSVTAGSSSTPIGTMTAISDGWYRCTFTLGESISLSSGSGFGVCDAKGSSYATASGTNGVYFWGAQLNEGSTAKPYFPTTDRLNVPRLDYSGGCPSLLLEPQRTNEVLYSEQFDNAYWTKAVDTILTANYGTSPDGTQNADRLVASATSGGHIAYRAITVTGTHTISIFAKASGYNYLNLAYDGGSLNFGIIFNLSNGTISQNPAGLTGMIKAVGTNGWYRCTLTYNYSGSEYFVVAPHDNSGSYVWTGNGTDGVIVWGAQVEAGSYPTSYIPTTSASVTRVADAASKTGISSLIGQTEGTFYLNLNRVGVSGTANFATFGITDGSGNNRLRIISTGGVALRIIFQLLANVIQYDVSTTAGFVDAIDQQIKIAVAYKSGDIAVYINGQLLNASSNTLTFSAALTDYELNDGANGLILSEALLFKTRLTNAELAALTTL